MTPKRDAGGLMSLCQVYSRLLHLVGAGDEVKVRLLPDDVEVQRFATGTVTDDGHIYATIEMSADWKLTEIAIHQLAQSARTFAGFSIYREPVLGDSLFISFVAGGLDELGSRIASKLPLPGMGPFPHLGALLFDADRILIGIWLPEAARLLHPAFLTNGPRS